MALKNKHKISMILIISALIILLFAVFSNVVFLAPSSKSSNVIIGCAAQDASGNKNCGINSLAMLNYYRYPSLDTSPNQLSREITACFLALKRTLPNGQTFNPINTGLPLNYYDDAKKCKKEVMASYGVRVIVSSVLPIKDPFPFLATGSIGSESLRTHRNRYGGSPF